MRARANRGLQGSSQSGWAGSSPLAARSTRRVSSSFLNAAGERIDRHQVAKFIRRLAKAVGVVD